MHHHAQRVRRWNGVSFGSERARLIERRQQVDPVAGGTRHNGSQSRSQAKTIDDRKRSQQGAHPRWIGKYHADRAALQSLENPATMIALDERPRALDQLAV